MANLKFSQSLVSAGLKAMFNSSEWTPTGDPFTLKDFLDVISPDTYANIEGNTAEVITRDFEDGSYSKRIKLSMKDGSALELKLSGKSDLDEGDLVDISSITGQELRKIGQDNIVRFDGKLAENK